MLQYLHQLSEQGGQGENPIAQISHLRGQGPLYSIGKRGGCLRP